MAKCGEALKFDIIAGQDHTHSSPDTTPRITSNHKRPNKVSK